MRGVLAGFRVQGNIPVWDSGRPLTAQREAERNLQAVTFNQMRLRARSEAQTAIERYERARHMVARDSALQTAGLTAELDSIKKQFESGQADILNVYAVQNGLLQEQRTHLDLLNEVAQAAADVTLMAGLSPACLVTNRPVVPQPEQLPAPQEIPTS
jgi:outer membrane protein TolC